MAGVFTVAGSIHDDPSGAPPLLARFDGEAWTTYDYLAWDIAVGPDGVAWFSGSDGLVSFDGTAWTNHIQGQQVRSVDVAPDGTVWCSDQDGPHTLAP